MLLHSDLGLIVYFSWSYIVYNHFCTVSVRVYAIPALIFALNILHAIIVYQTHPFMSFSSHKRTSARYTIFVMQTLTTSPSQTRPNQFDVLSACTMNQLIVFLRLYIIVFTAHLLNPTRWGAPYCLYLEDRGESRRTLL
jgi:hypothetical protein